MKQSLDVFKSFIERLLIAIKKKYILCTEYCVSPNILQTLLKLLKIVLSDTKLMQTSRLTNLVSILKRFGVRQEYGLFINWLWKWNFKTKTVFNLLQIYISHFNVLLFVHLTF